MLRQPPPAPLHPAVAAWRAFMATNERLFVGSADGRYLRNRLKAAFLEGWNAAEARVNAALTGRTP